MRRLPPFLPCCIALFLWAPTAPAADAPARDADEKQVSEVVEQLSSPDFAVREAAAKRLKELGPEYIPALQRYRDHPDAEVASRVGAVIQSFDWMKDGAIVNSVTPGSVAEKLGLKPGDVVVKINDVDIAGHLDLAKLDDVPDQTLHVWRAGKVRTIKRPQGKIGYRASNWVLEQGGNNHSRGVSLLAAKEPDLTEAYKRLRTAREEGMADQYAIELLSALAARELEHPYAMECYRAYREISRMDCNLTHQSTSLDLRSLPFDGPHTTFLLERYRNDPWSAKLYHELEDWTTRHGRNYPWARELVDKPWPDRTQTRENYLAYDDLARIRVSAHDRRWDEALAVYADRAPSSDQFFRQRAHYALGAAIRGGKTGPAADIAVEWLDELRDKALASSGSPRDGAQGFWALAVAATLDDRAAADRILRKLELLDRKILGELSAQTGAQALYHPSLSTHVVALVEKYPELRKLGAWEQIYLTQLAADPATTPDKFNAAVGPMDARTASDKPKAGAKTNDPNPRNMQVTWAVLTGLMRFDDYDRAREISAAVTKGRAGPTGDSDRRIGAVAAFAKLRAKELAGELKDLHGLIDVLRVRETTWALRWDGRVFRIDADGKLREFPGLPTPPAPLTVAFAHLRATGKGMVCRLPYGRNRADTASDRMIDVPFLFDEKAGKWVPVDAFDGDLEIGPMPNETPDALAMREVARKHPLEPGRPPRRFQRWGNGRWFEGNLLVWVDPAGSRALDCAADIQRQTGLGRTVQVYLPENIDPKQEKILLCTDAGAWLLDTKALTLSRVKLGLNDENVATCSLPAQFYGRSKDWVQIGVLPQSGGQIFRVDATTFEAKPTTGICGLGPKEWFNSPLFAASDEVFLDVIHQFYVDRLQKAK